MKRILSFFLTVALSAALLAPGAAAVNEAVAKDTDWLYITIDPGHGGDGAGGYDPGAINSTYGYQEADRVLRIGLYLKQELETYRHVHVDMTRSDRDGTYYTAPLSKVQRRVDFAQQKGSDLLVSLHLNGAATQSAHGALIIEHCFISSDSDSAQFLSSEAKLQAMAQADARGIAAYYGLEKKTEGETDPEPAFRDCRKHWAREYVDAAAAAGWVAGVGNGLFAPDDALTRGMFVTMLARLAGVNQADYPDSRFSDVEASAWYAPSVSWAASKGIVSGVGDGKFEPNRNITRQEMAVIMAGYLAWKGIDTTPGTEASAYNIADLDDIAPWALKSVCFCYEKKLLTGRGTSFAPLANATRAEACVVLCGLHDFLTASGG